LDTNPNKKSSLIFKGENKYRLLSNLNQTDNQICKVVKINNIDIWLESGNSLHQRKKPLGQPNPGNQLLEEIANYKKFVLTTLCSSHSLKF
jgi:hypothetical protein